MNKSDVIRFFGTQRAVADALGIKQSAVSQWGEDVPELRAFQIERIIRSQQSADSTPPNPQSNHVSDPPKP